MTKAAIDIREYIENPSQYNSITSYNGGVNLTSKLGQTALMLAAQHGHIAIVRMLIDRGAYIDKPLKDKNGLIKTALIFAVEYENTEIVELLLQNNATTEVVEENKSPGGQNSSNPFGGFGRVNSNASNNIALNVASVRGNIEIVKLLLKYKAVVNTRDGAALAPLIVAINNNHKELVEILLEHKADTNITNRVGDHPLTLAVQNVNKEVIKILLNKQVPNINTALKQAVLIGEEEIVQLLFEHKAQIENLNSQNTPSLLMIASMKGYNEVIKILLSNKANVNEASSDGKTPLMYAVENGNQDAFNILIESKASITTTRGGYNVLMAASKGGSNEIIKTLLDKNSFQINNADQDGKTPLIFAIENGHTELVRILLNNGADPFNGYLSNNGNFSFGLNNQIGSNVNSSPLIYAIKGKYIEIAKILLNKGVDVDQSSTHGKTPLMLAVENGDEAMVSLLIDNGADINKKDQRGHNALVAAAENGHDNVVEILLDNGAQINDVVNSNNALTAALTKGHQKIAQMLIEAGVNIDLKLLDYIVKLKQADLALYVINKFSMLDFIIKISPDQEFGQSLKNSFEPSKEIIAPDSIEFIQDSSSILIGEHE